MNQIKSLRNEEGQLVDWGSDLENVMIEYFDKLFTASNTEWEEVVECVSSRVTEDQNSMMLEPVQEKEVKEALFHMHPDKSPGPDGMTPGFYQKFWPIVGGDLVTKVQQFFTEGKLDDQLFDTNIALVPKKKSSAYDGIAPYITL